MYASGYGRFNSPDPYQAKAGGANNPSAPQTWNRYTYVVGDPVNLIDPHGLFGCNPITCWPTGAPADPPGGGGGGCTQVVLGAPHPQDCGSDPDPGGGGGGSSSVSKA